MERFVNNTMYPTVELDFAHSFRNVTNFLLSKVDRIFHVPLVSKVTIYLSDIR